MTSSAELHSRVHFEQVRQMVRQAPLSLFAMPVIMIMVSGVIWDSIPPSMNLAWMVGITSVTLTRWYIVHKFKSNPPNIEASYQWARYFFWLEIASGLAWGALSLMLPMLPLEHQMFAYIAYLGMVAGTIGVLAPLFKPMLAYVVPYTIANSVASYWVGEKTHVVIATAGILFALTMLRVGWNINRVLRESYALRFENIDLQNDMRKTAASLVAESMGRREVESRLRMSQMEYQNVLENMEDTYYRTGRDGAIVYTSPSVDRMLGYRREELVGVNMGSLYSDDNSRESFLKALASSGGAVRNYEVHLRRKDGSTIWVAVSSRYWHDENGAVQGVEGIAREITEVKEAQEKLLKAKNEYQALVEFLRAILDRVPAGMVVLNQDLEIEFVNDEMKRLTGAPLDKKYELIGRPLSTLQSVVRAGQLDALDALKNGLSIQRKFPFSSLFGKHAVIDIKGVPLMSDGFFKGAVLVAVDVSEQEKIQSELRRALELSEEIGRAKTALLANVSHELRTPLNGIMGAAHLLLSSPLGEAELKYVNLLYRSAETLLTLVNQILDLSKIEAGKMELAVRSVALRDVLVLELDLLMVQARQKGLKFSIDVAPLVPEMVDVDVGWLRSVLLNLVGNAIKFTEHGEVTVSVGCEQEDTELRLHFVVADTGIGIAKDRIGRIFDSFTQADTSLTRKYGGTGLGTTIAKELVLRMGGKIWVESELKVGSQFHFTLPLANNSGETALPQHKEVLPLPLERGACELKLLLVEDNKINQLVLRDMLERIGHTISVVDDGVQALDIIEREHFDVILMDIQMPGMDGMQVTRELRGLGVTTPVIAMTAHAMSDERAACLLSGMNDFVVKPVDIDVLSRLLAKYYVEKELEQSNSPRELVTDSV